MKLSSKTKYGIKAMYYLSLENNTRPISLKCLATKADISQAYLEKILSKLRNAGILEAVRGVNGGYLINKPLDDITLLDLIATLEGEVFSIDCLQPTCKRECPNKKIFQYINDKIYSALKNETILDVIDKTDLSKV